MLRPEVIENLEAMGYRRWKKDSLDRLYITPEYFGLKTGSSKYGDYFYSQLAGMKIDNTDARIIKKGKYFIDVNTGHIGIVIEDKNYAHTIKRLIRDQLNKARTQPVVHV